MANFWEDAETRALRLLADLATFGLSSTERIELDELLARVEWLPRESMEMAAAAVQLVSVAGHLQPLPSPLGDRIKSHGHCVVGGARRRRDPGQSANSAN
jgi:hypothetical protein